jgi:hypothetical protein
LALKPDQRRSFFYGESNLHLQFVAAGELCGGTTAARPAALL